MKKIVMLAMIFFILAGNLYASPKEDVKKGNLLYNNKKYGDAANLYKKALEANPKSGIPLFNLGLTAYRQGSYFGAIEKFNSTIATGKADLIPKADYNIGNAQYRIGAAKEQADFKATKELYETALKFYKRAIDLDPRDKDAKFNYEFVEKKLNDLAEKYQFKKDQKQDQKKDQKQDQKKDQSKDKQQQKNQDKDKQQGGGGGQGQEQNKEDQQKEDQQKKDQQKGEQKQDEQKKEEQQKADQNKEGQGEQEESHPKEQGSEQQQNQQPKPGEEQEKKPGEGREGSQPQEEKEQPESGQPEAEQEKPQQEGLEAYQAPQANQKPGEMSEQEAKMLLEGYKGEEATGMAVRMRKRKIDLPEPAKDW